MLAYARTASGMIRTARNSYLASLTTVALATAHYGAQFAITAIEPNVRGRVVTSHRVVANGNLYIVRVGETLPASAIHHGVFTVA
jgi:hypothetical protein